jgi:hypothetical protein
VNTNTDKTGYNILFLLINLDEKGTNPELSKFLNKLPPVYSIPNVFFLCRNKKCKNKECKKNSQKINLISNYIGTYFPLDKWVNDLLNDKEEGVLNKIKLHNFKEK